jgi:hypothetical protein
VFPLLVKCNNIVIILRFGNYALSYRPMIRMGCCLPLPQLDDTRLSGYQYQTLALFDLQQVFHNLTGHCPVGRY